MSCVLLQRRKFEFQEESSDLETQLLELGFLCEKDDGARQIAENYGFYAAHISRWVSTDPTWLEDGINLYAYVHGNPVSGVDPSGTQTDDDDLVNSVVNGDDRLYDFKGVFVKGKGPKIANIEGSAENSQGEQKKVAQQNALKKDARTSIEGTETIESYSGEFPSPLKMMWYIPESEEIFKIRYSAQEIRSWVREAALYHDVPYEMLAVILQQENGPNATSFQKMAQFAERTLTTAAAILDNMLGDLVPDKASAGSSGFANMTRRTLNDAADYTERVYGKNPLSDAVRFRVFEKDCDTRISGNDWKADLYYAAAHLRQLIDQVKGQEQFHGSLSIDEAEKIFAAYNGSGPKARKYGEDARNLLTSAMQRKKQLYFYQK